MGSVPGVEWGVNHPTFMRGLILVVPVARSDNPFGIIFDAFYATITLDPNDQGGAYATNPTEGIRRAALIYVPRTGSDEYLATLDPPALAEAQQEAADA